MDKPQSSYFGYEIILSSMFLQSKDLQLGKTELNKGNIKLGKK